MEDASTLDRIVGEVARISNIEGIGPDTRIGDINVDSLKFVELLLGFVEFFPGEVELDQLNVDAQTTLRQLDAQLRSGVATAPVEGLAQ